MPISIRQASARTDEASSHRDPNPITISTNGVRRAGTAVAVGTLIWAAGLFAVGGTPDDSIGIAVTDLTGLAFQCGLFALLTTQLRTRATGTSRAAVAMIQVEYVLLTIASLWSLLHGAFPAIRGEVWLAVLDVFWPLSMLGMAIIGVKIAFTGRWRGAARVWPVVAESWAPIVVPAYLVFGQAAADIVAPIHLLFGYLTLGLVLALRPGLTGARQ